MRNMFLSVHGVSKHFVTQRALDDVTFSVRRGEVLGLIGPNGAGKTTLFECIAGLLPANGGTVRFNDQALPIARRKEALFYMPDGIVPWADQSVKWALRFFEKLRSEERRVGKEWRCRGGAEQWKNRRLITEL